MVEEMRRQTEDIIRYYGELSRRISSVGVEGVPQLIELSKQLEIALAEVSPQELEWVGVEIKRLLDRLVEIDSRIDRLRELKTLLDVGSDRDDPPRRRSAV